MPPADMQVGSVQLAEGGPSHEQAPADGHSLVAAALGHRRGDGVQVERRALHLCATPSGISQASLRPSSSHGPPMKSAKLSLHHSPFLLWRPGSCCGMWCNTVTCQVHAMPDAVAHD